MHSRREEQVAAVIANYFRGVDALSSSCTAYWCDVCAARISSRADNSRVFLYDRYVPLVRMNDEMAVALENFLIMLQTYYTRLRQASYGVFYA